MVKEDAVLALGPDGADGVFQETGALAQCPDHPEIFIRVRDADKRTTSIRPCRSAAQSHPG